MRRTRISSVSQLLGGAEDGAVDLSDPQREQLIKKDELIMNENDSIPLAEDLELYDDDRVLPVTRCEKFWHFLKILGPGLIVMLADTDAGCIVVAAQSGALYGYKLITTQIFLLPIVFMAQELTTRIGIITGKGHGELIADTFGKGWAWLSVGTLVVACCGAMVTEIAGVVGVGNVWGVNQYLSATLMLLFMCAVVFSGSYKSVERIALCVGLFELVFVFTAFMSSPDTTLMGKQLGSFPIQESEYAMMVTANIGAVVMPWMIFYQQSAVVDKKLRLFDLPYAQLDTFVGACLTQMIMVAVIVTAAAATYRPGQVKGESLDTVEEIVDHITPHLGELGGKVLFSVGMLGASAVGGIVVSLTAAWGLGEVTGYQRSLEHTPKQAPWFFGTYFVTVFLGWVFALSGIDIVKLNVWVEVMNALMLPIVLGFLFALAIKLPRPYRLEGWYMWLSALLYTSVCVLALVSVVWDIATPGSSI